MYNDRCLVCGEIVPEGRDVCPDCTHRIIMQAVPTNVTVQWFPQNEMRLEDMRRVLVNFIGMMPGSYRHRTANATVVRDIILHGTQDASIKSCCALCKAIGCDPFGYGFPEWTLEEMGGRKEARGHATD